MLTFVVVCCFRLSCLFVVCVLCLCFWCFYVPIDFAVVPLVFDVCVCALLCFVCDVCVLFVYLFGSCFRLLLLCYVLLCLVMFVVLCLYRALLLSCLLCFRFAL